MLYAPTNQRVGGSNPDHVGMDFAPFRFFYYRKISHVRCHSSSFAKGHIRVGYSIASALITPLAHYQPFASIYAVQ